MKQLRAFVLVLVGVTIWYLGFKGPAPTQQAVAGSPSTARDDSLGADDGTHSATPQKRAPAEVELRTSVSWGPGDAGLLPPSAEDRIAAEDLPEDEAIAADDNSPEQRVWRLAYADEKRDSAWTERMKLETAIKAKTFAQGDVKIANLSCRETICRMHLQFADQLDAEAFMNAPRDTTMKYEFQSLDPSFHGEGFDASDHTYEVMVKRSRPAIVLGGAQNDQSEDETPLEEDDIFVSVTLPPSSNQTK